MIRVLVLTLIAATASRAAIVRGTVVENFTGKLLSRAVVILEALPGTPGGVRTVRTSRLGAFEFESLAAGAYVLKASRRGFMPAEHGQKRWNSAGRPLILEEATTSYITLRLPRFSAVNGTVVDENEIGLPGQEVAVYKATQPPEYIREAAADDRGVFRVGGLTPGRYFVRTVGKQYEEGSYLPTFSRETVRPDQAQLVDLFPEQEIGRVDIRPIPGRLLTLTVGAPDEPNTFLTLASAIGRKRVEGSHARWSGLPPGEYEVYSESETGVFTYQRLSLSSDMTLSLIPAEPNTVTVTGGPRNGGKLRLRRKDLAGPGPEAAIPLEGAIVPAGRWEILFEPPDGQYVTSTFPNIRGRLDGWLEYTTRPRQSFGFRLSDGAATLTGVVKDAPYAPVYLEAYDSRLRQRAGELKAVRADAQGQFRFGNLAPGAWRILSTYEYLMPDSDVFDIAAAASVTLSVGGSAAKDLDLWEIR
jgi:hypothetical protein